MKVINQAMTLLKVENKKGTGKSSGKPYDFYTATLIDEDANLLNLNLSREIDAKSFESDRNVEVLVDIEIKPKGFGLGGTVTRIVVQ